MIPDFGARTNDKHDVPPGTSGVKTRTKWKECCLAVPIKRPTKCHHSTWLYCSFVKIFESSIGGPLGLSNFFYLLFLTLITMKLRIDSSLKKLTGKLIAGKIGNNSLPWKGCIIGMQLFTTHNDGCKSRFPGIAAPPVDIHCAFHAFAFVTRKQIPLFYKVLMIAIVSHRITRCNLNPRGCSDCCR